MKLSDLSTKDAICYQSDILINQMIEQLCDIRKILAVEYHYKNSFKGYEAEVETISSNLLKTINLLETIDEQYTELLETE